MSVKKKAPKRSSAEAALDNVNIENQEPDEKVSKEILVIAQEVKIVKSLADNDVNKRIRQVRKLRKWFQLRSRSSFPFTDDDFMRIWKGLYYTMWMSDKPLVQEDLAEQLAQLVECFDGNVQYSVQFFGTFMRTMCQEWFGIDQWRLDKFLMLARRMLRYTLRMLKKSGWSQELIQSFNERMQATVLSDNTKAQGLTLHYLDIFFEELAKVSEGEISVKNVNAFLLPFVSYVGNQRDSQLVGQCRIRVLFHLLYQSSLGREYSDKYNAWKEMGFPTSSIDDLEKNEDCDESHDGKADSEENGVVNLDPRAGDVDVYIPELPVDADCVINELERIMKTQELNSKRRKALRKLISIFQTFKCGEFPLGVKKMPRKTTEPFNELIEDKVEQLENLENEAYGLGRELKKLNKRKRRKLLRTINFDNIDDEEYEDVVTNEISKLQTACKRIKKAQISLMSEWKEEAIDDNSQNGNTTNSNSKTKSELPVETEWKEEALDVNSQNHSTLNQHKNKNATDKLSTSLKKPLSEWDKPVGEGETEYFIPSRKLIASKANKALTNPTVKLNSMEKHETPLRVNKSNSSNISLSSNSTPKRRVKIVLKHNTAQKPSDYIKQIRSSPQLPYDAAKKPGKGLLKPNSIPSPINPFYKKKIGLKLLNDTL